jgi:hypothetical protein
MVRSCRPDPENLTLAWPASRSAGSRQSLTSRQTSARDSRGPISISEVPGVRATTNWPIPSSGIRTSNTAWGCWAKWTPIRRTKFSSSQISDARSLIHKPSTLMLGFGVVISDEQTGRYNPPRGDGTSSRLIASWLAEGLAMLVHIQNLFDEATCFATLRQLRWPEGAICPHCSSKDVT